MSEFGGEVAVGRRRFPVWAIGVVLAAAFLLFLFIRNRSKAQAVSNATGTEDVDSSGLYYDQGSTDGLPLGAIGDYLNGDPTNPAYPVGLSANGVPGPVTNVQWSRLAADDLLGKGNDPALVTRALAKYIISAPLSQAEQAVVNMALTTFGSPPEGLILTPEGPSTPAPQPDAPAPGPGPAPGAKPAPPASLMAPAMTNLYTWSQQIEAQYTVSSAVINQLQGKSWGGPMGTSADGDIPYYPTPRLVHIS